MNRSLRLFSTFRVCHAMLCLASFPSAAIAQPDYPLLFRARLTDSLGVPQPGAIVIALSATGEDEIARAISNASGDFSLRVDRREIRLRVLSIGHQPTDVGVLRIPADGAVVTIRVTRRPIVLPAIVARETARCGAPSTGSAAAVLLAEARKAIVLAVSVPASTPPRATIARFAYWTAPDGTGRRAGTVSHSTGASLRPFQSVPKAVLDAEGYVVDDPDGTVYRAPDVALFADESFARENCFSLVEATAPGSSLIGIGFEPRSRSRVVRVAGILWLDSTDFRLSHVDFRYVGLDRARTAAGAGGTIRLAQLPGGLWFEERWELRMPQLQTTVTRPDARIGQQSTSVVQSVRVNGGQVVRLQVGEDVRFVASDLSLDLPGNAVSSPSPSNPSGYDIAADSISLGACSVDANTVSTEPTAELTGRVLGAPAAVGVKVSAEWRERFRQAGAHQWRWTNRVAESITTPGGRFTFCSIPTNRAITLRASHESSRAGPTVIRIADSDRVARVELRLTSSVAPAGQRTIRIVSAEGAPVPYATVSVNGGVAVPAQVDGTLRLRLSSRAAARVMARRIGFVPVDTTVSTEGGDDITVEMQPVAQSLHAVVVSADPTPLERAGFYDRAARVQRGAYTADFLTPEMLDQRNSSQVSHHLLLSRFVSLEWSDEPRRRRVARGRAGCKMEILVDGQRPNTERTTDREEIPIDEMMSGLEVAAIEVYPSIANAPAELIPLTGRGECGLIAFWTGGRG